MDNLDWIEGFATASIGSHLIAREVAWPWAYLIGCAGGMVLTNTISIGAKGIAYLCGLK